MISAVGRVIMVSGANRGIGLSIAKNLYKAGSVSYTHLRAHET